MPEGTDRLTNVVDRNADSLGVASTVTAVAARSARGPEDLRAIVRAVGTNRPLVHTLDKHALDFDARAGRQIIEQAQPFVADFEKAQTAKEFWKLMVNSAGRQPNGRSTGRAQIQGRFRSHGFSR